MSGFNGPTSFAGLTGSASVAQMGSTTYANGSIELSLSAVDVNVTNTDYAIPISLPTGYTRFCVSNFRLSHGSISLTTATFGLFTAAAGGGTAVVGTGSGMSGITTASENVTGNMQNYTIVNQNTACYTLAGVPNMYFRVQTAQGAPATVNVSLIIIPLP